MNVVVLQCFYDEPSKHIHLWCKHNTEYVLVKYPFVPSAFVHASSTTLHALDLEGEPVKRTWGTGQRTGVGVPLPALTDEQRKVLIGKGRLFEHDVPAVRQFMITHKLRTGSILTVPDKGSSVTVERIDVVGFSSQLSLAAIDIETYAPDFALSAEKYPVVSISVTLPTGTTVYTFDYDSTHDFVVRCVDEQEMITRSLQSVYDAGVDVVCGFNSDGFDFWYILKRAKALGLTLEFLEFPLLEGRHKKADVLFPGPIHVDLYPFCRYALRTTLKTQSYSLNAISEELLGEQKMDVDMRRLAPAWDAKGTEFDSFLAYNKKDTELTYTLCEKLLPNMLAFAEFISLDLADISRMSFSGLVEYFLITRAYELGYLIPPLPDAEVTAEREKFVNIGGYVHEPKPGIYESVLVADFSSLYPSIIVSHNLDPAFTDGPGGDKKGFIPLCINELITARKTVKQELKAFSGSETDRLLLEARNQNLKVLANAMYGYLSFNQSRWYSSVVASNITSFARQYTKDSIAQTQAAGFDVLYGDTDSIFFTCSDNEEKAIAHVAQLNAGLPGVMHLDVDDIFVRGIFVPTRSGEGAKKKYALLRKDDTLKIIGFESIRHDWCAYARESQKKLLYLVLSGSSQEEVMRFVQERIAILREKRFAIEDIVLTTKLKKPLSQYKSKGPHVTAALRMQNAGEQVGAGSIISYVITSGPGTLSQKTRLVSEVGLEHVDAEYYVQHQLRPVVESILDVFGVAFPRIGGTQMGLGDF